MLLFGTKRRTFIKCHVFITLMVVIYHTFMNVTTIFANELFSATFIALFQKALGSVNTMFFNRLIVFFLFLIEDNFTTSYFRVRFQLYGNSKHELQEGFSFSLVFSLKRHDSRFFCGKNGRKTECSYYVKLRR